MASRPGVLFSAARLLNGIEEVVTRPDWPIEPSC